MAGSSTKRDLPTVIEGAHHLSLVNTAKRATKDTSLRDTIHLGEGAGQVVSHPHTKMAIGHEALYKISHAATDTYAQAQSTCSKQAFMPTGCVLFLGLFIIIGVLGQVNFGVNFRPFPPRIKSPTYVQFINIQPQSPKPWW